MNRFLSILLSLAALPAQQSSQGPVFRSETNLVLLNVFVRDRQGNAIPNLKREDFQVVEDGKPQTVSVFEFQSLAGEGEARNSSIALEQQAQPAPSAPAAPEPLQGRQRFRDRRLLVMFFDLSAMDSGQQVRAIEAAEKFIREQMTPADLVSIMTFGASLRTEQEFTADRDLLLADLKKIRIGESSELAADGNTDTDSSDSAAFAADETEFNIFNTDRKLSALESAAAGLRALAEKKALIYFSAGVGRTGVENESQLRSTINAAVRANVSFYPVDVRGLAALPPGGDASTSSPQGTALYSAQAQTRGRDRFAGQQETLSALASDTGGKALLDNNDLTSGIQQAQRDVSSYYILGYYSANEARDGRFRKVQVKLAQPLQASLEFRSGYYAEKEFKDFTSSEKERQLEDALMLGDPRTDLPLALEINYFRLNNSRFFVPLAVKIPGSAIPLAKKGSDETTDFDFIGEIRDSKNTRVATVRDAIRIRLRDRDAGQLGQRSLVYDTGFTLAAGKYRAKMLVRENRTGKMGTFETPFEIPSGAGENRSVFLSSLVWSSQREPVREAVGTADKRVERSQKFHPLVRDGEKLIPSVTRVFRPGQKLYLYFEVYDPTAQTENGRPSVAATVSFLKGGRKVFESRPAIVSDWVAGRGRTVALQLQLSLDVLPPGDYLAQVNLIDQPGARFKFARTALVILPAATKPPAKPAS